MAKSWVSDVGGVQPLRRDGVVIGAIGVGGSGPDSDEEIATLAARALDGKENS